MNGLDDNIKQRLKTVAENLEMTGLGDHAAWQAIVEELESLLHEVPDAMAEPADLLRLCGRGGQAMAGDLCQDTLSLIDAMSRALMLVSEAGENGAGPDIDTEESSSLMEELAGLLGNGPSADATADSPRDALSVTLDDAAALWIQTNWDDLVPLADLKTMLDTLAVQETWPDPVRQKIVHAAQKIDIISDGSTDDPDAAMTDIGALLEEALNDLEEAVDAPDSLHEPQPAIPDTAESTSEIVAANEVETEEIKTVVAEVEKKEPEVPDAGEADADEVDQRDYMPDDADPEMLGEFITEASDLIEKAEQALLTLETDPDDEEAVGMVFRAFHTVKGTSAFLELTLLNEIGHLAESLLSRVRDKEIRYGGGYADLALRSLDMIKDLVTAVEDALGGQPWTKPDGYTALMTLLEDPEAAGISDEMDDEESPRVGDILVAQGAVAREAVEDAADECGDQPIGVCLVKNNKAKVADVGKALRTQERMKKNGTKAKTTVIDASVRVSTLRLDRLIDMVGELVVANSMVAQNDFLVNSNHHELLKKVNHASKIVRELQDISMSMRMIPMKSTFQKMARLVRDLSRKVGKDVRFITEGEETEIDRNMVDVINDPLVHMIRNAVDHGIELPEVREAQGKPQTGTVHLSAYHSAGSVVVEIRDDGKGLDREGILRKAVERNLIGEGDALSDREIYNLIFEPGFSTAATVTDVSGRGVGMDVVKKNLEALRGTAEIQSEKGQGSTFKMRLPLTLAIIDGMVVRVAGERYVLPTVSIIRTVQPSREELSTLLQKGEMFSLQDRLIPLFRLANLFHSDRPVKETDKTLVVVVEYDGKQIGLMIDELLGRQQVVIKTLGETLRSIPGISGGAIMPDGRVGLIVDIDGLVKLASTGISSSAGLTDKSEKHPELAVA